MHGVYLIPCVHAGSISYHKSHRQLGELSALHFSQIRLRVYSRWETNRWHLLTESCIHYTWCRNPCSRHLSIRNKRVWVSTLSSTKKAFAEVWYFSCSLHSQLMAREVQAQLHLLPLLGQQPRLLEQHRLLQPPPLLEQPAPPPQQAHPRPGVLLHIDLPPFIIKPNEHKLGQRHTGSQCGDYSIPTRACRIKLWMFPWGKESVNRFSGSAIPVFISKVKAGLAVHILYWPLRVAVYLAIQMYATKGLFDLTVTCCLHWRKPPMVCPTFAIWHWQCIAISTIPIICSSCTQLPWVQLPTNFWQHRRHLQHLHRHTYPCVELCPAGKSPPPPPPPPTHPTHTTHSPCAHKCLHHNDIMHSVTWYPCPMFLAQLPKFISSPQRADLEFRSLYLVLEESWRGIVAVGCMGCLRECLDGGWWQ